jgi:hypothetical protein
MLVSQDDPQQTVQIFIDLIQRHEQSFYYFVHKVHSKGEGLFTGLMRWIELFLDVVREGLGETISLEFILPHTGDERRDIIKEIDAVAIHHYKLKVAYESRLRRRFGRAGGADIGGDDENAREIVGGLVRDVSVGDLMKGGVLDMAAEEEENSDDSYQSSSEYETDSDDGETGSEENSEKTPLPPGAQLHASPSTPSLPKSVPRRSQEEPFPPSQQSKLTAPSTAKSPSPPAPPVTPRTPSVASPPSSTGTRLRKLSLTLRKSRSMTFDATRPSPANKAEAAPPVPSLPQSVAQARSVAAGRSKELPMLPPLQTSSPSAAAHAPAPPARHPARASVSTAAPPHPPNSHTPQKRYPSQKLPQVPPKRQGHGALKAPELKKITELLPIFVEMVRENVHPCRSNTL